MQYVLFHLQVRNDYHCPNCKQPIILCDDTVQNIFERAMAYIDKELESRDVDLLKDGYSIWIDEWVRRRNGDKYQIFKIKLNREYDLRNLSRDLGNSLNNDNTDQHNLARYLLLHVRVRKLDDCPDNIIYYISFHKDLESAYGDVCNKTKIIYRIHDGNMDKLLTEDSKNTLMNLEELWINLDDSIPDHEIDPEGGDYFQIIRLKQDEIINLNQCCSKLKGLWSD